MILGGKRAGHVARRSGYAVEDKLSCLWVLCWKGRGHRQVPLSNGKCDALKLLSWKDDRWAREDNVIWDSRYLSFTQFHRLEDTTGFWTWWYVWFLSRYCQFEFIRFITNIHHLFHQPLPLSPDNIFKISKYISSTGHSQVMLRAKSGLARVGVHILPLPVRFQWLNRRFKIHIARCCKFVMLHGHRIPTRT